METMTLEKTRALKKKLRAANKFLFEKLIDIMQFGVGIGLTDEPDRYRLAITARDEDMRDEIVASYNDVLAEAGGAVDIRLARESRLPSSQPHSPAPPGAPPAGQLAIGSRIRHRKGNDGTLGFFATDSSGTNGVVSCNHVIGLLNMAKFLFFEKRIVDESGKRIGEFRNAPPLKKSGSQADCAFAKIDTLPQTPGSFAGAGAIRVTPATINRRMSVRKIGAATSQTIGTITAIEMSKTFQYQKASASFLEVFFDDVIEIESTTENGGALGTFSNPGDSGSLVVTEDLLPVGMLFFELPGAGGSGLSYANPIQNVLHALDVTIKV